MRVVAVPCLKDNYAYLVIECNECAVVDPGEAAPVLAAIAAEAVKVSAIWLTHHHADHVDGVAAIVAQHPGVPVVAGAIDAPKIAGVTVTLQDGETTPLGPLRARAIHNPGHTNGAVSFAVGGAVFTGDTLFGAGCGRMFEGNPAQMHASLMRIASLPEGTLVYFGHEYTASNLKFAQAVEPSNLAVVQRTGGLSLPSTPTSIRVELATNPFLRCSHRDVIAAARAKGGDGSPAGTFGALREWKNKF